MTENITNLNQFGPVNTKALLAMIVHFGTCENVIVDADAPATQWTGPQEMVNGKPYYSSFIAEAIEHVTMCENAQSEFANVIDATLTTQPAATPKEHSMDDQPELELEQGPNALDLASEGLEGVILIVNDGQCDHHYDLAKLVEKLRRMQFSRCEISHTQGIRPGTVTEWDLTSGDSVGFYEITAGEQFVVSGAYAYSADEVKRFLIHNGHGLTIYPGTDGYNPPAWYIVQSDSTQTPAGLGQQELDGEEGQLLHDPRPLSADPDDVYIDNTGLTRLPAANPASQASDEQGGFRLDITDDNDLDDPRKYDHPVIPSRHRSNTATQNRQRWLTSPLQQLYASGMLGFTWVLTIWSIMHLALGRDMTTTISITLSMASSTIITPAVGLLGGYTVSRRPVAIDFIREEDQQQMLAFAGATIAWGSLVLIDLVTLLN